MVVGEFGATVRHRGEVCAVDLEGDIDIKAGERLQAAYAEAASTGPSRIVLNFEKVGYINSSGIALIVELLARARSQRRTVTAYGLTDHYQEIFNITRLSDFVTICADEDAALHSAASGSSR
jgi:anti-anti-sigma factor